MDALSDKASRNCLLGLGTYNTENDLLRFHFQMQVRTSKVDKSGGAVEVWMEKVSVGTVADEEVKSQI